MSIALKEANETEYWLELLIQSETLSDNTIQVSLIHCKEICKILNTIVSTARKSLSINQKKGEASSLVLFYFREFRLFNPSS